MLNYRDRSGDMEDMASRCIATTAAPANNARSSGHKSKYELILAIAV